MVHGGFSGYSPAGEAESPRDPRTSSVLREREGLSERHACCDRDTADMFLESWEGEPDLTSRIPEALWAM